MITDYTAMLSMGRAQVLLHDGTTVETDIIYDKHAAAAIQGKKSDFSYYRILWDGDRWVSCQTSSHTDRSMARLFINRFLQAMPSSNIKARIQALIYFVSSELRANPHASLIVDLLERRFGKLKANYPRFGYRDYMGRYNTPRYTLRKHRFTQRQRDYRRLKAKRNAGLASIVQFLVNTYSGNCADFSHGSSASPSDYSKGWTLRFSDMKIVAYGDNSSIKREVDLSPFNLMSPSFVALFGVRNVFCANIVEETGDTICLQVFGKNSKPKGYVCAKKNGNGHIFKQEDPAKWISLHKYGLDDIGSTKAEAYARMLARS